MHSCFLASAFIILYDNQGSRIIKISICSAYHGIWSKHKKNTLQTSEFPLVLHAQTTCQGAKTSGIFMSWLYLGFVFLSCTCYFVSHCLTHSAYLSYTVCMFSTMVEYSCHWHVLKQCQQTGYILHYIEIQVIYTLQPIYQSYYHCVHSQYLFLKILTVFKYDIGICIVFSKSIYRFFLGFPCLFIVLFTSWRKKFHFQNKTSKMLLIGACDVYLTIIVHFGMLYVGRCLKLPLPSQLT